jgi:hypothetical protein
MYDGELLDETETEDELSDELADRADSETGDDLDYEGRGDSEKVEFLKGEVEKLKRQVDDLEWDMGLIGYAVGHETIDRLVAVGSIDGRPTVYPRNTPQEGRHYLDCLLSLRNP